jgi:hypothetical protein
VATLAEAAEEFGEVGGPSSAPVGQHTSTWRTELDSS